MTLQNVKQVASCQHAVTDRFMLEKVSAANQTHCVLKVKYSAMEGLRQRAMLFLFITEKKKSVFALLALRTTTSECIFFNGFEASCFQST